MNLQLQIALHQLHHLYTVAPKNWNQKGFKQSTYGIYGLYDILYDLLIKLGHEIKFSAEDKKEMWELTKIKFKRDHKSWLKQDKEFIYKEMKKLFKSFLVRKYLMDRFDTQGVLVLSYENGERIKRIEKLVIK